MITKEELKLHAKWLRNEPDGVRLVRLLANLAGANLAGANLRDADLTGADLRDAKLTGAKLAGADLTYADLRGAGLRDADLRDADLRDAKGLPIATDAADRLKAVAQAALQPDALEMSVWHTCGTTHCIAGWAIHLAGEPGRAMESMMGAEVAGLLLLGTEAHQHFHDSNEKALEYLRGVVCDG
jgi:hypothetical protein